LFETFPMIYIYTHYYNDSVYNNPWYNIIRFYNKYLTLQIRNVSITQHQNQYFLTKEKKQTK